MGQFSKALLLLIMHTAPQRTLNCGAGLGGLNQVMGPTISLPLFRLSVKTLTTFLPEVQLGILKKCDKYDTNCNWEYYYTFCCVILKNKTYICGILIVF